MTLGPPPALCIACMGVLATMEVSGERRRHKLEERNTMRLAGGTCKTKCRGWL